MIELDKAILEKTITSEEPIQCNIWIDGVQYYWKSSSIEPASKPYWINKFLVYPKE